MGCNSKISGKSFVVITEPQQPFCDPCANNDCKETIDARCVIYHSLNNSPSKLESVNMPNGSSIEAILEAIDDIIVNNFNIPITKIDTDSIIITLTGGANHTVKADLQISADLGNAAEIREDGLFVGGASGAFTAQSGEEVTVVNGIIVSIV